MRRRKKGANYLYLNAKTREVLSFVLVFALLVPGWMINPGVVSAATYTWAQVSWDEGVSALYPNHTDNKTGWANYESASSSLLISGGNVSMVSATTTGSATQTSATDFALGTAGAGTFVVGANNGSGVALCTYDHGGADWTPADDDIWDLNDATAGIYIAGTHCNIGTFSIPSGTVNVMPYDNSKYGRLKIYATTITIGGTLDAGSSGGVGGWTAGFTGYGGSHGGIGENSADLRHGSSTAPTDFGDGGRDTCFGGSNGGGAVYLSAGGTMTVSGTISSNGGDGSGPTGGCGGSYSSGAGAGGSIYLTATTLAGAGAINANGGSGGHGGGGGRIAFYYTTKTFSGTTSAIGQTGGTDGTVTDAGAGSYPGYIGYLKSDDDNSFINQLLGIEPAYAASGSATFTSSIEDTGAGTYHTYSTISWGGATSSTASFKFQIASSNSVDGPWDYYGPTGIEDYYTNSSTSINTIHNGDRYVRYRATLETSENLLDTPMIGSVSIGYNLGAYPTSQVITSSAFNAEDVANVLNSVSWGEATTGATSIKFQFRSAPASGESPGTWTSWMGPGGSEATYFTNNSGTETMPASLRDGVNDQWFQYRAFLVSDGTGTPTLNNVSIVYVVNAPPELNPAYGTEGVYIAQVATTTDSNWGKVKIDYSVRDPDTLSGTTNAGYITPSFQYDTGDGLGFRSITSGYLSDGATSNKEVGQVTFVTYSAYWDALAQISGVSTSSLKVKVTINDNEGANNTTTGTSATTTLDTIVPLVGTFRYDASAGEVSLVATDTPNNIEYRLSNASDLSADGVNAISGSWQVVGSASASTTISWVSTNATSSAQGVYLNVRDGYNLTSTSLVAPGTPSNMAIRDVSNASTEQYRLFLTWDVYTASSSATFSAYELWRSAGGADYTLLATRSSVSENFYSDQNLATSTEYSYKVRVLDTDGDRSAWTSVVSGTPGANSDLIAPVISAIATSTVRSTSAHITWTTDEIASSTVEYSTTLLGDYGSSVVSDSFVTAHDITLSGLSPATNYVFRVRSTDPTGNSSLTAGAEYNFTTASGPVISAVTAGSLSDTGATITWTTSVAGDTYVTYATSTATLIAGNGITIGGATLGTAHSVTISGLVGRTDYYYLVKSTDADGNLTTDTNGGTYYTFATTYDETGPVISNIATPVLVTDAAVVTWDTNELADGKLYYGATSGTYTSSVTASSTLTISHSITASSLSASTPYYFIVVSSDANGNQATSSENTFTTTATAAPTIVTNTIVVPISGGLGNGGGGTVSQSAYDDAVKRGDVAIKERDLLKAKVDTISPEIASSSIAVMDITPFTAIVSFTTSEPTYAFVSYGDDPVVRKYLSGDQNFVTEHKVALSGLRFGTEYSYSIKVLDKGSNTTETDVRKFTTKYAAESLGELSALDKMDNLGSFQDKLENLIDSLTPTFVPPFIADVSVSEITEDSATLSWSTNSKTFGSVLYSKDVEYEASSSAPYIANVSDTGPKGQAHTVRLTNLEPLSTYHYAVTAFAIFGVNRQTPDATFVTLAPKVTPEIGAITTDGFTAFWKTTTPASSIVEYKNLKTGEVGKVGREDEVTAHTVAVEHLAPNTPYEVKIYGYTKSGSRVDASQTLSVRTKLDNQPPSILNLSVSNAFIPNRNDRLQTVITWRTDEPATGSIKYGEGAAVTTPLGSSASDGGKLGTEHAIILTSLKPATLYRFSISSTDVAGNTNETLVKTMLTPRESESVVGVIIKNFEDTFGFLGGKK